MSKVETGLLVSVLKDADSSYDCTAGGASSKFTRFVAMGDMVEGPFDASPNSPALYIYERNVTGTAFLIAVPEKIKSGNDLGGYMFGGNFVYSSDSRFPSDAPIKVFDRKEW